MARIYRKILAIQHFQPNAPVQIGDMRYTYDAAGNPTSILDVHKKKCAAKIILGSLFC